jgi:hypothetical protein
MAAIFIDYVPKMTVALLIVLSLEHQWICSSFLFLCVREVPGLEGDYKGETGKQ